jgi:colanic acid/amylovoran biosynthesis glycosyltransferase
MDAQKHERSLTIFLVVNSFPRVSETFLFNLVTGLELKGVKVVVLALAPSADQAHFTTRRAEWSGRIEIMPQTMLQWVRFGLSYPRVARTAWASWKTKTQRGQAMANAWLKALVQTNGPEWVHFAYSGIGVQFLEAIEAGPNQRWMVSCRGSAEIVAPLVNPKRGEELRRLFQAVTSIHCVSQHMVQTIVRWGAPVEKTFVNFPSIDPVRFRRSVPYPSFQPGQPLVIVSTGRLNFQKGYPYALLAMRQLQQLGVDFQYHIIGDGEDRSEVVYLIEALHLSERVILHGKRSSVEVQAILEQAHVFLLTSLYEGIANAALEAMALEIPVVSTRAGGMAEVIQSGTNGVLVDCLAVEEVAVALASLVKEPHQLATIGKQGRQTVLDHHVLEQQMATFLKKYA